MGRFPGGQLDAVLVVPDRIGPILEIESCAVGFVMLFQETDVFFQGLILHKICADYQAAVGIVRADPQGFVHDFLGILDAQGRYGLTVRWCFLRIGIRIKKGHLRGLRFGQAQCVPANFFFLIVCFGFVEQAGIIVRILIPRFRRIIRKRRRFLAPCAFFHGFLYGCRSFLRLFFG